MKRQVGLLQALLRTDSGTALIEAAVVIPLAITLMAGLVDFGRAYFTRAAAEKSTRDAVRYLTSLPPSTICGWGLTRAKYLAVYGNIDGTGDKLVMNWLTSNITLALPSCPASTAAIIHIDADVPFAPILWPVIGLPDSITLKVSYEARWIGS